MRWQDRNDKCVETCSGFCGECTGGGLRNGSLPCHRKRRLAGAQEGEDTEAVRHNSVCDALLLQSFCRGALHSLEQ